MASDRVNIGGDSLDTSFRYKMPRLQTKIEGKGNGIKTVILNIEEVGVALNRKPKYIVKFFANELGALSKMETGSRSGGIVNGSFQTDVLQELMKKFVDIYVLCFTCHLPETELYIGKQLDIYMDCTACGNRSYLDMSKKLIPLIARDLKQEKAKRKGNIAHSNDKTRAAMDTQRRQTEQMVAADLKGDVKFTVDTSEDAAKKRLQEEIGGIGKLAKAIAGSEEVKAKDAESFFTNYVSGKLPGEDASSVVKFIEKIEIPEEELAVAICGTILTIEAEEDIKRHADVLEKLFYNNRRRQKYLLLCLEKFIGDDHREKLLEATPTILHSLYSCDALEEENILAWHTKLVKKFASKSAALAVRSAAEPFIHWLKTAEEEDSESSSDE